MKPRRKRRAGSLGSLKGALWAVIEYNLDVIGNPRLGHDLRQTACNSLTQAAGAYRKILEDADLEKEMRQFEHRAESNGHQT